VIILATFRPDLFSVRMPRACALQQIPAAIDPVDKNYAGKLDRHGKPCHPGSRIRKSILHDASGKANIVPRGRPAEPVELMGVS
jgi:hypothetical protein